jgi:DNA primase
MDKILAKYNINNVDEKVKASHELCRVIATFSSDIERELYSRKMSTVFEIPLVSIQKDVSSIIKRRNNDDKAKQRSELYRITSGIGDKINPESASNIRANKIEEAILGLMLLKPEHLNECTKRLSSDNFVTPFCKKVFESITAIYKEYGKFDIGYIQQDFSVDQTSRITKMMTDRQRLSSNDEAALDSLISSLIKENAKAEDSDSFDDILNAIKNKKQGN